MGKQTVDHDNSTVDDGSTAEEPYYELVLRRESNVSNCSSAITLETFATLAKRKSSVSNCSTIKSFEMLGLRRSSILSKHSILEEFAIQENQEEHTESTCIESDLTGLEIDATQTTGNRDSAGASLEIQQLDVPFDPHDDTSGYDDFEENGMIKAQQTRRESSSAIPPLSSPVISSPRKNEKKVASLRSVASTAVETCSEHGQRTHCEQRDGVSKIGSPTHRKSNRTSLNITPLDVVPPPPSESKKLKKKKSSHKLKKDSNIRSEWVRECSSPQSPKKKDSTSRKLKKKASSRPKRMVSNGSDHSEEVEPNSPQSSPQRMNKKSSSNSKRLKKESSSKKLKKDKSSRKGLEKQSSSKSDQSSKAKRKKKKEPATSLDESSSSRNGESSSSFSCEKKTFSGSSSGRTRKGLALAPVDWRTIILSC